MTEHHTSEQVAKALMINWTKMPPSERGWYWWRNGGARATPQIVRFEIDHFELCGTEGFEPPNQGQWWPEPISVPVHERQTTDG